MEAEYRLITFVSVLLIMVLWEVISPRRAVDPHRLQRWTVNLGLVAISSVLVRITVGGIVYHCAIIAQENNIGLLHWLDMPLFMMIVLTLVFLDFVIYGQHVASHKIPMLWRLHQVHHSDLVYDTTTGVRFHPLEIFFSLGVKVVAVFILGADPAAVIIFEIILNTCSVFNHANIDIPLNIDKQLRKIIVTPDMHRVHHSVYRDETDSNYGFSVSFWDRLCGTYKAQPRDGHKDMEIGLNYVRQPTEVNLPKTLLMPFHSFK